MAIAPEETPRCSAEEWEHLRWMGSHGMLFEVIDWIDAGNPTLRPEGKRTSALKDAARRANHSLVKVLWERAWQERDEAFGAAYEAATSGSTEVMRYVIEAGLPLDHFTGYDLFLTNDLKLIRSGLDRGINLMSPDGYAAAFLSCPSRPLIRFYLEEHGRRPGLIREGARALKVAIREGRMRAVALLNWAGVDPFTELPWFDDIDVEPGEEDSDDCEDDEDKGASNYLNYPVSELVYCREPIKILATLKLKPTIQQWLDIVQGFAGCRSELVNSVFELRPDGRSILERHPERAASILQEFFCALVGREWRSSCGRESAALRCQQLIRWGVPLFAAKTTDIDYQRRMAYKGGLDGRLAEVLRMAWDQGDDQQRARITKFVDKPKMRTWVREVDREFHCEMGLEPPGRGLKRTKAHRKVTGARRAGTSRPPRRMPRGGKLLTREQIHRHVWTEPAMKVAERYGVSSSMLARICTRLDVPRPGRGHWAKSEKARQKLYRPLKPPKEGMEETWVIDPNMSKAQKAKRREV